MSHLERKARHGVETVKEPPGKLGGLFLIAAVGQRAFSSCRKEMGWIFKEFSGSHNILETQPRGGAGSGTRAVLNRLKRMRFEGII